MSARGHLAEIAPHVRGRGANVRAQYRAGERRRYPSAGGASSGSEAGRDAEGDSAVEPAEEP